jgi:hypothetical protein
MTKEEKILAVAVATAKSRAIIASGNISIRGLAAFFLHAHQSLKESVVTETGVGRVRNRTCCCLDSVLQGCPSERIW